MAHSNSFFFRNQGGEVYETYSGEPWNIEDKPVSRAEGEAASATHGS